jgi:carbonic anhydrase
MSVADEIVKANTTYAQSFNKGDAAMPPKRHVAIVTCMDARILPTAAFGLDLGDAHVIRNAGGRAADALRSLVISQRLLGTTEVVVVHHTDCGMLTFTNDDIKRKIADELGPRAASASTEIDFLPFPDVSQSVRDDVAFLRASPLIPQTTVIRGFVYDVRTGRLAEIDAGSGAEAADRPRAAASTSARDASGGNARPT